MKKYNETFYSLTSTQCQALAMCIRTMKPSKSNSDDNTTDNPTVIKTYKLMTPSFVFTVTAISDYQASMTLNFHVDDIPFIIYGHTLSSNTFVENIMEVKDLYHKFFDEYNNGYQTLNDNFVKALKDNVKLSYMKEPQPYSIYNSTFNDDNNYDFSLEKSLQDQINDRLHKENVYQTFLTIRGKL